ncbi:MAG: transporter substrate-binding domain-containing protein [Desulfococcaceae bacterium]
MGIRFFATVLLLLESILWGALLFPGPAAPGNGRLEGGASGPVILVGGDYDYPPYEFFDESGRPTGYNVELTRAVAEAMGLNVRIRLGPWGEIRRALENREIHAIHGMFHSEERARRVDFSAPHTIIYHSAFARRSTPPIDSLDDLAGKSLVVMRGDILHDFAKKAGLSDKIHPVATQAEALRELAAGKHDYALTAKLPGVYLIRELGLHGIRPVGPPLLPSRYCYAVPKGGNPELLSAFNEGLAILNQTGRYAAIYEKWLGPLGDRDDGLPRRFLWWFLSVIGLLLLLILCGFFWNRGMRRQVNRRTELLTREIEERKAAEQALQRWGQVFEHARWGVAVGSANGQRFEMVNPHYARLHGYEVEELLELPIAAIRPPNGSEELKEHIRIAHSRGHYAYRTRHRRKDGSLFPVEVDVTAVRDASGKVAYRVVHLQDVTERERAETEMRRLNRRLQTIRECDRALVTARSESEMLRAVCRTLVETGGYRMAWVGFARGDEERTVYPAASWGVAEGRLDRVRVAWSKTREGSGSVGRAIRTGAVCVEADLSEAPDFAFWRALAETVGFRSAISLPLFMNDRVIGALSIYGESGDAFGPEEQELLEELADDLAFGVAARRGREERRMAEIRLRESEGWLKAVLSSVQVGIAIIDAESHRLVDANPAALRMMRRPLEDVKGRVCHQFLCPAEEGACPIADLDQEIDESERELLTADGESLPILKSVVRVRLDGRVHLLESFIDISARKAAEAEREKLIEELRTALSEIRTLRGFLPICASCKKIRDDEGYWHQIEIYIRNRADVDFTHGICPECQDRLYGDLFGDEEDDPAPE